MIRAILFVALTCFSTLALADAVCVTIPKANLRKGPGTNFPVSWTVGQNMPFLRLEQKGPWSKVRDLDGVTHWITSKSVSAKYSCAVVKTKVARLRKAPDIKADSADIETADRYTPFKKIERDGEWLLVQDDYRGEYWVNESNVWIPMVRKAVAF